MSSGQDIDKPRVIEGQLQIPEGSRFVIVASRFNNFIVDRLVEGAVDTLVRHGAPASAITVVRVPGAWELPLVVSQLASRARGAGGAGAKPAADSSRIDAIIAVGTVIRGATPHFDYIAAEVSKGLANVALLSNLPVTFGVITADTIEQAIERAGTKAGNKGIEAALSAIELVSLSKALEGASF